MDFHREESWQLFQSLAEHKIVTYTGLASRSSIELSARLYATQCPQNVVPVGFGMNLIQLVMVEEWSASITE